MRYKGLRPNFDSKLLRESGLSISSGYGRRRTHVPVGREVGRSVGRWVGR